MPCSYALVSGEMEKVVEFFGRAEAAVAKLAEVARDDPALAFVPRVDAIEIGEAE